MEVEVRARCGFGYCAKAALSMSLLKEAALQDQQCHVFDCRVTMKHFPLLYFLLYPVSSN